METQSDRKFEIFHHLYKNGMFLGTQYPTFQSFLSKSDTSINSSFLPIKQKMPTYTIWEYPMLSISSNI